LTILEIGPWQVPGRLVATRSAPAWAINETATTIRENLAADGITIPSPQRVRHRAHRPQPRQTEPSGDTIR
jgi:hypothetical protein